ncbi:hypothetical protein AOQ84DRAFT_345751 [Glonium stellatum]|uniref:Exonuclease V n=1 Tax=Glonium stellatum TaxID=574774 RepID=A0A8E2EU94_9PEZI|nr:hypothetical protein AOQ84DRAFT_345751 [Glonium stellatum]
MAISSEPKLRQESHSDYGSDFDTDGETLINNLLTEIEASATGSFVLESIEDDTNAAPTSTLRVSKARPSVANQNDEPELHSRRRALRTLPVEVEYDEHSRMSWNVAQNDESKKKRSESIAPKLSQGLKDTRSPLQRFRTKPKKPLSVTDLVSPAWCELQYWYTLTKFGRKKATPAMKQGSEIHRILEEQDHIMEEVQVKTKEDMWGLKIWNVIQGLRSLRTTGITRELEVWGVVEGEVINGIIDEISYVCPDPTLEEVLGDSKIEPAEKLKPALIPDRAFITEEDVSIGLKLDTSLDNSNQQRKAYITDIKTRTRMHLPQDSSLRGTLMQLMLYRLLLESLVTNAVPSDVIFARYSLKPLESFSSSFIAQIVAFDLHLQEDTPSSCSTSSRHELESHNNLSALWKLMIHEFSRAISSPSALGRVLKAEFRHSNTGEIIGNKTFAYDANILREYLIDEISWWKGERQARGVDVEEAFKCRMCEFSEECIWRKEKVEEAIIKNRLRATTRAKSAV